MYITELRLKTPDPTALRSFYAETLGFPLLESSADSLAVQAGASRLIFKRGTGGPYHFAFNIPENQIEMARDWLIGRGLKLRLQEGNQPFRFEAWDAHGLYFDDPDGNILECIARHTLSNPSSFPFSEASFLNISEIGLAADDVLATVNGLTSALDLLVYSGAGSDAFTAVGNENGLFIVVKRGRIWYPDTGIPAEIHPVTVRVMGVPEASFQFDSTVIQAG